MALPKLAEPVAALIARSVDEIDSVSHPAHSIFTELTQLKVHSDNRSPNFNNLASFYIFETGRVFTRLKHMPHAVRASCDSPEGVQQPVARDG
jgi:hypothetical protein